MTDRGVSPVMHIQPSIRVSKCIGSIADSSINECQLLIGISKEIFSPQDCLISIKVSCCNCRSGGGIWDRLLLIRSNSNTA